MTIGVRGITMEILVMLISQWMTIEKPLSVIAL